MYFLWIIWDVYCLLYCDINLLNQVNDWCGLSYANSLYSWYEIYDKYEAGITIEYEHYDAWINAKYEKHELCINCGAWTI